MRVLCVWMLCLSMPLVMQAQQTEVYSSDIRTIQVKVNGETPLLPIISLRERENMQISFDQLSHEFHRYQYVITHHDSDWSPSDLQEIDYLDGFNNNPIETYENSINTSMLYTHYSLTLPNEDVKLKLSGNYILAVYDDSDRDKPVFRTCFRVVDKQIAILATVSTDTDVDRNASHQQVSLELNFNGYAIRNPQNEVKVQIAQNGRTDNLVSGILPSYVGPATLRYEHNRRLIFQAGNEYRRFETITTHYASQGVDRIQYHDPYYYVALFPDDPRTANYIYDEDRNGRFLIRSVDATDQDVEADYFYVHFSYPAEGAFRDGKLYLLGDFAYNDLNESTELTYNPELHRYESVQLLKQGAYNYQYLYVPNGSKQGNTDRTEGNYYETENEYTVFIYHRPFGGRYDQLIGYTNLSFR